MDNFKLASQEKLRFQTPKGLLSTEQLWDLSLEDLDTLAVSLEVEHQQSGKKSFLVKSSAKDKIAKLRFDIAYDVLLTKKDALQAAQQLTEDREHNKKIIALIVEKKDESLKRKSVKELEGMLR